MRNFILLILIISYAEINSQNEFIIGTWRDPLLIHNDNSYDTNFTRVKYAKDAFFNLLSGAHYTNPLNHPVWERQNYDHNKRYLEICDNLDMNYMVVDTAYKSWEFEPQEPISNPPLHSASYRPLHFNSYENSLTQRNEMLNNYLNVLPSNLREHMYAYNMGDEPEWHTTHPTSSINLKNWTRFINYWDPEMPTFINLYPIYRFGDNINEDPDRNQKYESYLDYHMSDSDPLNNFKIIGFDHYPFSFKAGDGYNNFRSDYFYNLRVVKERSNNRTFWAYVNTTTFNDKDGNPVLVNPMESHLRFSAFCPIAYGAKGLIYWIYQGADNNNDDAIAPVSIENIGGNTGLKEKLKYKKVQNINHFISDIISPIIMNSKHIGTYHKDNNYLNIPINSDRTYEFDASVMLNPYTPLIQNTSSRDILFGLFENKSLNETYILVVNKSLATINDVSIVLKGNLINKIKLSPRIGETENNKAVPPYHENSNPVYTNVNATLSSNTTTFSINHFRGGEGRIIKVDGIFTTNYNREVDSSSNNEKSNDDLLVYPNPNKGVIHLNKKLPSNSEVKIFDLNGKEVFRQKDVTDKLNAKIKNGLYIISIYSNNKTIYTSKITF